MDYIDLDIGIYPLALIGSAVIDFKKVYDGPIVRVTDVKEVREFVSYYSFMQDMDRVLVVEDYSFLNKNCQPMFLKFIEETSLKLIVLSYTDKFSSTILSRFKRVVKYYNEVVFSKFGSAKSCLEIIEGRKSELSYMDRLKVVSKESPVVYYIDSKLKNKKSRVYEFI